MCVQGKSIIVSIVVLFMLAGFTGSAGAVVKHMVVIDPAHGGSETGVQLARKTYEKDLTLKIGTMIAAELVKIGNIEARLTRSKDVTLSLAKRWEFAGKAKGDLFVSIHVNAGFGNQSRGYEVYFSGFDTDPSRKENADVVVKDMAQNQYRNDSVRFAHIFQRNFSKVFPRQDRGLRDAPFPVYDGLAMPAVVIELGFATNIKNKKQLNDDKIQQAIADAIVKSIREFFVVSGGQ